MPSILAPPRNMPDPIPPYGGMLTIDELEACKRVLRMFLTRRQTLAVMEMSRVEQDMYVACHRAGYLFEYQRTLHAPPFYWCECAISDAGRAWLAQISETKA